MLRPSARSTTIEPILPQPITPSVLPVISTPMKRFFSHLPAWVEASACGICARQREHQGDRVLGGGDRIAEGRVHHDDALRGRGRDIDIVDADAGAADHLQVLRLLEDLRRHLGGRADREAVEIADDLGELVLVLAELRLEIDLDAAILEDLHGGGRQSIGNENLGAMAMSSPEDDRRVESLSSRMSGHCCPAFAGRRLRRKASRRLGAAPPWPGKGPVEPRRQRRDDRSARPSQPHQMRRPGGASR